MADTPDDATWLPEGALVVLGACSVGGCDRVGWALPTYGRATMRFVIDGEPSDTPPHVMEGALLHVAWWCPVHGTGAHEDVAQRWAQDVMNGLQNHLLGRPEAPSPFKKVGDHICLQVGDRGISVATGLHEKSLVLHPLKRG